MDYHAQYHLVKAVHNGKPRTLTIPSEKLKSMQRKELFYLSTFPVSPYANAYLSKKNVVTALAPHIDKPIFVGLDLDKFFNTITSAMIYASLRGHNVSIDRASQLTALCTYNGRLPFGAPTSPAISNIVFKPVDDAIASFCGYCGLTYSRYSDDLYFSGNNSFTFNYVMSQVPDILYRFGYKLNHGKTRVNPPVVLGQSMLYPPMPTFYT